MDEPQRKVWRSTVCPLGTQFDCPGWQAKSVLGTRCGSGVAFSESLEATLADSQLIQANQRPKRLPKIESNIRLVASSAAADLVHDFVGQKRLRQHFRRTE